MSNNISKPSFLRLRFSVIFFLTVTFILISFLLFHSNILRIFWGWISEEEFLVPEVSAQGAALGCHTGYPYPAPSISGSFRDNNTKNVSVTWTWPADKNYADVIECEGTGCNWLIESSDGPALGKPIDNLCADPPVGQGYEGCPCNLYGPLGCRNDYSCTSKGATATCTYTDIEAPSHAETCELVVCYDSAHWRMTYYTATESYHSNCVDYGPCGSVNCNNPPTIQVISPPNGKNTTANWINSNPTFTAQVSDPDGGNVRAYFNFSQIAGNPTPPPDQNGTTVPSGSNSTWTPSPALLDGKYDWRAKAIDSQGAQSGYTRYWRVKKDTLPPNPSCSVSFSSNNISISVSSTDPDPVPAGTPSGIEAGWIDESTDGGATWTSNVFSHSFAGGGGPEQRGKSFSQTFNKSGNPGITYTYRYRVSDLANNQTTANCGSVTIPIPFDYSLSNSGNITVIRGTTGTNTIIATLTSGTSQPVSFNVSGLPANTTSSFSPDSCSPSCTTVLKINTSDTPPKTPLGDFTVNVIGTPLSKRTSFTLSVRALPLTVSCQTNPSQAKIGDKVTWTADASGGSGPYSYSWSGEGVDIPDSTRVENCNPGPDWRVRDCQYLEEDTYSATVNVTDSAGDTANSTCTVEIRERLPIWREIPP